MRGGIVGVRNTVSLISTDSLDEATGREGVFGREMGLSPPQSKSRATDSLFSAREGEASEAFDSDDGLVEVIDEFKEAGKEKEEFADAFAASVANCCNNYVLRLALLKSALKESRPVCSLCGVTQSALNTLLCDRGEKYGPPNCEEGGAGGARGNRRRGEVISRGDNSRAPMFDKFEEEDEALANMFCIGRRRPITLLDDSCASSSSGLRSIESTVMLSEGRFDEELTDGDVVVSARSLLESLRCSARDRDI